MRRLVALLAVAALSLTAAPALGAPAEAIEILQYARTPDAPGADRAKERLARRLQDMGLEVRGFQRLPMLVVSGPDAALERAVAAPEVLYHHRGGRQIEFALDRSVPLVFGGNPEPTWNAGYDGRGVTVAVMDTGVDSTHPDLIGRVTRNVEFLFQGDEVGLVGSALPPVGVAQECLGPCNNDTFGHGTHVAGTVAGDGSAPGDALRGVSPGAKVVGLSISQSGTSLEFYALAGFDYILAHPELDIRVVNNSWRIPRAIFDPTDPLNQATKMLHDRGIAVVFAAGNDGSSRAPRDKEPEGSSDCSNEDGDCRINIQSVAPWTISVAAGARVRPGRPGDQHLADFSSRGDPKPHAVEGGLTIAYQPTLTAPGTGIIAATGAHLVMNTATCGAVGDLPRCLDRTPSQNLFYMAASGTSMASPHVAGAAAVLQSAAKAKLGRFLSPDEVKGLLVRGAQPMGGIDAQYDSCGTEVPLYNEPCGQKIEGTTGKPYESWQVGAGYLDVAGSLRALDALTKPAVAPQPPLGAGGQQGTGRVTVRLARLRGGRLKVSGRAPAGARLTIRLLRGGRARVVRRLTVGSTGRYQVRVRARGRVRIEVVARLRDGRVLRVRSRRG